MLFPIALGTLIGMVVMHFFSAWPPGVLLRFTLLSLVLILLIMMVFVRHCGTRKVMCFVISICIGWGWAYYQIDSKISAFSTISLQETTYITGKIVGLTSQKQDRLQFDVLLEDKEGWKIRCYWRKPTLALRDGDKISLHVKIRQPWSLANPGGFDQDRFYFIQGIVATAHVLSISRYTAAKNTSLDRVRQHLSEAIRQEIGDKPRVGVIQAMSMGNQANITPYEWKVFQATGTSHVIAISGSHVSCVASFFGLLVTFLARRRYRLTSYFPASYYGGVAAMISAILYSACAGFSVPTQRACIMVLVVMFALLTRQKILSWSCLALSWIGVGLVSPFAVLQIGFWLSFGCVAALIWGSSHYQSGHWLSKWVLPQWVVFIALLPFLSLFFQQIPILSPIANMLFLPLASFVIIPLSLFGLLGLPYCFIVAHFFLEMIWPLLEKISMMKLNLLYTPEPTLFVLLISTISVLFLLAPSGLPGRHLGWYGLLALLFPRVSTIPHSTFHFILFDVGQGLSALIQTQHHALLFDAGPPEAGNRVILPYMQKKGIKTLDKVIISHGDLDHRGGLDSLTGVISGDILTSEPSKIKMASSHCEAGTEWEWDGVHFMILNPVESHRKRNNLSCVLKVSTKTQSVLLTGDIEYFAEQKLVEHYKSHLSSDVLVVPHHGSLTSSSVNFIEAVSPRYALFPVGKDNRYHLPKQDVETRYEQKGIKNRLVWQTGAIIFHFDGKDELTPPIQWRDTFQHYWDHIRAHGE